MLPISVLVVSQVICSIRSAFLDVVRIKSLLFLSLLYAVLVKSGEKENARKALIGIREKVIRELNVCHYNRQSAVRFTGKKKSLHADLSNSQKDATDSVLKCLNQFNY